MLNFMVVDDPLAVACRDILLFGLVAVACICLVGVVQFRVLDRRLPSLANLVRRLQEPISVLKASQVARSRRGARRRTDAVANLHRVNANRELPLLLPELAEE